MISNKILLAVTIAVIIIPAIYTTLFLGSMWDPYGNAGQLPTAVVNHDRPVVFEGKTLNLGKDLMEELKGNNSLDFCFPSDEDAEEGLRNGRYYMVITIPENFSESAASLTEEAPEKMVLRFKTNPGTNYIASKMSETAMKELKNSIREEVTRSYAQIMLDKAAEAAEGMMQAAEDDKFSFHDFSLDATIFENKGEKYYIWAEKTGVGKKISNLYIARMENPVRLATAQVLLTTPDYDWERVDFWVNEGPAVLKHDGKIFMTFSASATGACYCMGLMYIDEEADVLDPHAWTKLRYPVLQTDEEKGIYGPGHNSFVKAQDGITDLCVYHARQYDEIIGDPLYDPNRHAMVMKVEYDEKGFPVFSYKNNIEMN